MFIHFLPYVKNIFRIYVFIIRHLRAELHFNVSRTVWINLNLIEFNIEKKKSKRVKKLREKDRFIQCLYLRIQSINSDTAADHKE